MCYKDLCLLLSTHSCSRLNLFHWNLLGVSLDKHFWGLVLRWELDILLFRHSNEDILPGHILPQRQGLSEKFGGPGQNLPLGPYPYGHSSLLFSLIIVCIAPFTLWHGTAKLEPVSNFICSEATNTKAEHRWNWYGRHFSYVVQINWV